MQRYTVYLYLETALHVSGGTSTHHQEHIQLYLQHLVFVTTPLLLSWKIWNRFECAVGGVSQSSLVGLPYVMWSAHFFVTNIQTEKISSWYGPTFHVCCFMLARAFNKTFVSRIHIRYPRPKNSEKIFVSRKIR
jgi:hypothetical protein